MARSRHSLKRKETPMNPHSHTGRQWIESDRIVDSLVFDNEGSFVGNIRQLLISRRSGHVEQVVVHAHGRFGFGARDFELPWVAFRYDTRLPGYRLVRGARESAVHQDGQTADIDCRPEKEDPLLMISPQEVIAMKRFLFVLVIPLLALPLTTTTGSAQFNGLDAEALCSEQPRHPACLAIFSQYCAMNPNEPVCLSEDDEDDDSTP